MCKSYVPIFLYVSDKYDSELLKYKVNKNQPPKTFKLGSLSMMNFTTKTSGLRDIDIETD